MEQNTNILISACLLGIKCRYNGDGYPTEEVVKLKEQYHLIPICPEQLGGLPTPRSPVEIISGKVFDQSGTDWTEQFSKGADESLKIARMFGCKLAVLKSRSPSCGSSEIYDGTFSGSFTQGMGITARRLAKDGIEILTEQDVVWLNNKKL